MANSNESQKSDEVSQLSGKDVVIPYLGDIVGNKLFEIAQMDIEMGPDGFQGFEVVGSSNKQFNEYRPRFTLWFPKKLLNLETDTNEENTVSEHIEGRLAINHLGREILVDGKLVKATKTEFELLEFLTDNSRTPFYQSELYESVWGKKFLSGNHSVIEYVGRIRRNILGEKLRWVIQNVDRISYMFDDSPHKEPKK